MAKVVAFAKTIRRHWKKSIFFAGIISYGTSYGFDRYKTFQMMRAYCEEAKKYGEKPLAQMAKPKHVTVILNPEANDKKANVQFEKFVAPLLHLAGFKVSVFQTEFEKQAGKLMEVMSNTDAVLIAGGNGTVQEVITGMMNRSSGEVENYPLGILPLGRTNTVANHLFGLKASSRAQLMAEAAMSVIREQTTSLDVLKIQFSGEANPVYAMCHFEQGSFAEVERLVKKYWYLGIFKHRFTYLRHIFKRSAIIENQNVTYVAPCEGCSKCFMTQQTLKQEQGQNRWWHAFIPKSTSITDSNPQKDYSKVINEDCGELHHIKPFYLNLTASTKAADLENRGLSRTMWIKVYPEALSITKFISAGISHQTSRTKADAKVSEVYQARELSIDAPEEKEGEEEKFCYIDDEKYPRTSCKITLLPNQIVVFS